MKLLILFLSLLIGVQSETLEELKRQIQTSTNEFIKIQNERLRIINLTSSEENITRVIENLIWAEGNETEIIENSINDVTHKLKSCQTTKLACLEDEVKTLPLQNRFNEVKQEEDRRRSELKALEDEQKNHLAKLEDLVRELNEPQNNLKLLEAELQELRLKLSECLQELKNHKTNQNRVNKKTDGRRFINKIITSTLDNVKQLKKSVANALRSKINLLKFNIPE